MTNKEIRQAAAYAAKNNQSWDTFFARYGEYIQEVSRRRTKDYERQLRRIVEGDTDRPEVRQ